MLVKMEMMDELGLNSMYHVREECDREAHSWVGCLKSGEYDDRLSV